MIRLVTIPTRLLRRLSSASLAGALAAVGLAAVALTAPAAAQPVALELVGRFSSGLGEGATEIAAYNPGAQRLYITNAVSGSVDIVGIADPAAPVLVRRVDLTDLGEPNSVATVGNLVAVAVAGDATADPGVVLLLDTAGDELGRATVGVLPDMVTFTPDGTHILVANEGEPNDDYTVDPPGTISIIDLAAGPAAPTVVTLGFEAWNAGGPRAADLPAGVRVFGPGASVAQDLEPEFIAVAADGRTAWVALQENNAFAKVDVLGRRITDLFALGTKDHGLARNALDPSNRDDGIRIAPWPVHGLFQPDAIAAFTIGDETYILSANEGDARDYDGFSEEARMADLTLDPIAFPNAAALQADAALGRLKTTTTLGDDDGDGDHDRLFAYGARSFSIWKGSDGTMVADSGAEFERVTAATDPATFNGEGTADDFDDRSDDKGPEPEAVVVGRIGDRTLAFIGLERIGGVMVYDVSVPEAPVFLAYHPSDAPDIAPEGLLFIDAAASPTGEPLLVLANEVSGTATLYRVVTGDGGDGQGACIAGATTLCLEGGRFAVRATWRTPDGRTGMGEALGLTDASGAFSFFRPENLELFIKVLDGCTQALPRFWIFASGLTDLEVGLLVTDTVSGHARAYTSNLGEPFALVRDTRTFGACP